MHGGGHTQSALCVVVGMCTCVSFMLSLSSPLLPQNPSDRARAEEETRRVCEHMCSVTVQSGVVTSSLSLSVSLCTHTHTVEAAATEGEEEGRQVSSHCQFSAGSVSCEPHTALTKWRGSFWSVQLHLLCTCTLPTA